MVLLLLLCPRLLPKASHRRKESLPICWKIHPAVLVGMAEGGRAPLLLELALQGTDFWTIFTVCLFAHAVQFLPGLELCFPCSRVCMRRCQVRSGVHGAVRALSSNPNPPSCGIKVFIVGESQGAMADCGLSTVGAKVRRRKILTLVED